MSNFKRLIFLGSGIISIITFGIGILVGRIFAPEPTVFNFPSQSPFALKAKTLQEDPEVLRGPSDIQSSFRIISKSILPTVIEIHGKGVVRTNPFFSPFFGSPFSGSGFSQEVKWAGSGVILLKDNNNYYALTNNHVIENASDLEIKFYNSSKTVKAEVKGRDAKRDIALISFAAKDVDSQIEVATLGDSDSIEVGDFVMAFGSPLEYSFTVTQGIVSATARSVNPHLPSRNSFIQTDASINQGNSGGPLVNLKGEVIGINTAIASPSGGSVGLGFAIPINDAKKSIERFLSGKSTNKDSNAWLGVLVSQSLHADQLKSLHLSEDQKGAFIVSTLIGSPSEKGGLKPGDLVVSVNNQPINSGNDLTSFLTEFYEKEKISLEIFRAGEKKLIDLILGSRPEDSKLKNQRYYPSFGVYPVTEEVKNYFRISKSWIQGVLVVSSLEDDSRSSIHQNDIITHIDGKVIADLVGFYDAINKGSSYSISLYRKGETIDIKI